MIRAASTLLFFAALAAIAIVSVSEPRFFSVIFSTMAILASAYLVYVAGERCASLVKSDGTSPRGVHSDRYQRLLALGTSLFGPKVCALVVEPAVSDLREEHHAAATKWRTSGLARHGWQALYILVRGYWSLLALVLMQAGYLLLNWLTKASQTS